jgi:hypothetical protein
MIGVDARLRGLPLYNGGHVILGLLTFLACDGESVHGGPLRTDEAVQALSVDMTARVTAPGAPAAWTAQAVWEGPTAPRPLPVGVCRHPTDALPVGPVGAESLDIAGSAEASLVFDPERGAWEALGPRRVLDPAWSVADVAWVDAGGLPHRAEDVVRFGGLPDIIRVERDREGAVTVGWDPETVGATEVRVSGPAGALVCGTGPDGTTLPWWVVPAYGGEVVLESVWENRALVDGVLVRVRTRLQRVIPLDRPNGTTAEEKEPRFRPYTPQGPVRLVRPARHPVG